MEKGLTFKDVSESLHCFLDSAIRSCCVGFGKCSFRKVVTLCIKGARQEESLFLVQILTIQKSLSFLHMLPALFWCCIDIFPNRTYFDACLISFLHSRSLVDPLSNEEIFVSVFPSVRHLSPINDIIEAWLDSVIEIMEGFELLDVGLEIMSKVLAEGAPATFVWEVGVDLYSFDDIPFLWLALECGGNCCSSVVAWSGLWCW